MTDYTTANGKRNALTRCELAMANDSHPCVGDQAAVTLAIHSTGVARVVGCVLHAAVRLADSPPSVVFLQCPPPGRASHALAALELARLITANEHRDLARSADEMWTVYVGGPPC